MNAAALTHLTINGKTYLDAKEIRANCKTYCKGIRSISQLILRKQYQDVVYGRVKDGVVEITPTMSRQNGTAFINKDELAELFVVEENAPVIPEAPSILDDKDLIFFKDEDGQTYDVLMRGERTRKGILFKLKDIERVFQMNRLHDIVQAETTIFVVGTHYQWFSVLPNIYEVGVVQDGDNASNRSQQDTKRELYLTYKGLMRIIYRANSGVGYKFQDWIDECVFTMNWGTQEQKADVVKRTINVDADHLKAIMGKSPVAITCLYLIDIGLVHDAKSVYKYGFTKDMRRRFHEHTKTYGDKIKLDTFIFIPELELSKAENVFRHSVSNYVYDGMDGKDELIALSKDAYNDVRTIFTTITDSYCGNLSIIQMQYQSMNQKLETQILVEQERHARLMAEKDVELANKDTELANKDTELANKDTELAEMKIQILELQLQMARGQN